MYVYVYIYINISLHAYIYIYIYVYTCKQKCIDTYHPSFAVISGIVSLKIRHDLATHALPAQ